MIKGFRFSFSFHIKSFSIANRNIPLPSFVLFHFASSVASIVYHIFSGLFKSGFYIFSGLILNKHYIFSCLKSLRASSLVLVKKSRHKKYFFLFHFFKSGHTSHFGPFVFFKSRHDMHFLLFFFF